MTIDTVKTLVDTIGLLLTDRSPGTVRLGQSVVTMADDLLSGNPAADSALMEFYLAFLRELLIDPDVLNDPVQRTAILLRYQQHPAFLENPGVYDQMKDMCQRPYAFSAKRAQAARDDIQNELIFWRNRVTIGRLMARNMSMHIVPDKSSRELLLTEIRNLAKEIAMPNPEFDDANRPIETLNLNNKDSIALSLRRYRAKHDEDAVLRTGLQALNRMLYGGMRIGDSIAIAALSHCYKTGMLRDLLRWMVTHNDPPPVPAGFKPTACFISLENEVFENMMSWYERLYIQVFRQLPPVGVTDEAIAEFILNEFGKRGWNVEIRRFIGDDFGFTEFEALQADLKAEGCWVVATYIDYATVMKSSDIEASNDATRIQLLWRKIANFARHTPQLVVSACQLDAEAERVANSGLQGVVNRFNYSMTADCKSIHKEVDVWIFMHIEKTMTGIPWLTLRERKYRNRPLPETVRAAWPFHREFGIVDDLDGLDTSVADIHAVTNAESEKMVAFG